MRPNRLWIAGLLALSLSLVLLQPLVNAGFLAQAYLPAIYREPSPTPTPTPTAAPTPTATPSAAPGTPDNIQGTLALCSPAQTTYKLGDTVCVNEQLVNGGAGPVTFGLVGVTIKLKSTSQNTFQTSWGSGRETWTICAGCTGPMDGGGGPWSDNLRGLDNAAFNIAGVYELTLAVCYSGYSVCTSGNADWRNYTPLTITVQ